MPRDTAWFVKEIWHTAHNLHTAHWVTVGLLALVAPSVLAAMDRFSGEHSPFLWTIAALIYICVVSVTILALLSSNAAPQKVVVSDSALGMESEKNILPKNRSILVPQDVYYTYDDAPGRGYPHKLWVVLTNESGDDVLVERPRWEKQPGDIDVSPLPGRQPWTPEGPLGWQRGSWGKEIQEPLHLPQGRTAKLWVGVLAKISDKELRRRVVTKRIGTVVVPLTTSDRKVEMQPIKL